jgi:phosphoglycerate dehydrogenase-like enzyme
MAQFAVGAIIAFASRIIPYVRQQIAREWRQRHVESIRGKTVVVVGLGQIGRAVAEKAVLLGMRAVGVRANPKPEPGVAEVVGPERLHAALAEGDVVVVACPLTAKTRRSIGRGEFQAMKRGALLVNLARGGVIDEPALIEALGAERLGGAALDVFEQEPLPRESPFWGMENVLVTPHCISDVADWKREAGELFCRNLELWLAGRPLFNVVEPGRGY